MGAQIAIKKDIKTHETKKLSISIITVLSGGDTIIQRNVDRSDFTDMQDISKKHFRQ
jgi:hypothetical protein